MTASRFPASMRREKRLGSAAEVCTVTARSRVPFSEAVCSPAERQDKPRRPQSRKISRLRLAVLPDNLLAIERHGRDRHFGRSLDDLPRMRQIDQRIVRLVVDAFDEEVFPYQRAAFA